MKLNRLISLLTLLISLTAGAQEVRWGATPQDSLRVEELIAASLAAQPQAAAQERVAAIAHRFIDTPYVAGTLEGEPETLTINLSQVDCTTFVDQVMALAMTAAEHRNTWRDFAYNLSRLRYRDAKVDGYASRLHYISDWAVNTQHRGLLREVTQNLAGATVEDKSIDFMSRHADLYPALKDEATKERIRNIEGGYRQHRVPIVKTRRIGKQTLADLREGDIVALTTSTPGLDVSHMAIITLVEGVPHLLHASSKAGKVIVDPLPLTTYLQRNRKLTGIRVFRLTDE